MLLKSNKSPRKGWEGRYCSMTRQEAKERAIELFSKGCRIESEIICENRKSRVLSSSTGYKWLVEYTRNEHGMFTASDVRLFDSYTESLRDNKADGRLIAYNVFN